jgi:O-Antigen ligase
MDFFCIVAFLGIYYLKPQEWTPLFAKVRFAQLIMIASVLTLISRARSLKVGDFLRTPHDWAMFGFFAWVVLASPAPVETFKEFLNRLVFYVVIVQTLTSWDRIKRFLGWWTAMIVIIAALAVVGRYFFDPLGSRDLTEGLMKGRLVLNLSMVNNPNALGHTVVPVIAMLYFFCVWRRPLFMKEVGLATFIIPFICVYLTESKGAYVAGAVTILATLTFGRPKIVQALIIALAIGGGFTAVKTLPRMGELQKTKTDEAIQGRIKAFTIGRTYYDTLTGGIGQGRFVNTLVSDHGYYKAAHSTYVQTGTELGWPGLLLFLLVLWTGFRTLIFAQTHTVEQERLRRILFVLVLSYCASGWMVDFAYRATFFMFMAAIGAFHRLLYKVTPERAPDEDDEPAPSAPAWRGRFVLDPAPAGMPAQVAMEVVPLEAESRAPARVTPWRRSAEVEEEPEKFEQPERFWNRLSVIDVAIGVALLIATERAWVYAIKHY